MKKLGPTGMKWMKIAHLLVMVLMMGGIISALVLRLSVEMKNYDVVYSSYRTLLNLSDHVIRYGAQGLLLTGILYGVWTNWGFFRHRWITAKWVVFMAQTVFGIAFIDRWMVENMGILEAEGARALTNATFLQNNLSIQIGATTQSVLFVFLIWVSVVKPWKKKAESPAR